MAATLHRYQPEITNNGPSLLHGTSDQPLIEHTLASYLDEQCASYSDHECVITPWDGQRWTYNDVRQHSISLANYLLLQEIAPGDRVAILAGNRAEYVSVFFACMRIGAILVILNNTYTTPEATFALRHTESKLLFTSSQIGRLDNSSMLAHFVTRPEDLSELKNIVLLSGSLEGSVSYQDAIRIGSDFPEQRVKSIQEKLSPYETCNLQFTSGSTGLPKAAMLTHFGLLNNARFIGDRMRLTEDDVLCCPPPLFHCFGLVLGLLACITHGSKIVYPSEIFDGSAVLRAISDERCTALHGVPAMFDTLFSLPRPLDFDCSKLRTGIIAGAPVPRHLMELLVHEFGMTEFTSSYGLTEASPTCFNATVDDTIDRRLTTVGTIMPHAHAKIIDSRGNIVPTGTRGELCIAGYQLHRGYWHNPEKTAEAMRRDKSGVLWLHTGDEAVFDTDGYCSITGRFKDIIIRGGENIYPLEIEERLVKHTAVDCAVVVGLPHAHYGEVVAAFLQLATGTEKPSDEALRVWTRETLGRHKAPVHIFWFGEGEVPANIPMTGSGKIRKFEIRELGAKILASKVHARL